MSIPFWRSRRKSDAQPAPAPVEAAGTTDVQHSPLRGRFIERLRTEYPVLAEQRGSELVRGSEPAALVHRMAGSAGMVGFGEISDAAGRLDDAILDGNENTTGLLGELLVILEKTLAAEPTN